MKKVLITGANGFIAKRLVAHLQANSDYKLMLVDINLPKEEEMLNISNNSRFTWIRANITKLPDLIPLVKDIDVVVHLAIAGREGNLEDDDLIDPRFDVNVKGTFNIFEAIRRSSTRAKVILCSSLTVVWGYPPPHSVSTDAPGKPIGTYGLTKYLGEEIARYHYDSFGIEVVAFRIARPIDIDEILLKKIPILPQWLLFTDLLNVFHSTINVLANSNSSINNDKGENKFTGFAIFTLTGDCALRRWDLEPLELFLGFRPSLKWEDVGLKIEQEPASYLDHMMRKCNDSNSDKNTSKQ